MPFGEGWGEKLVSFGTHKSSNHKRDDIICHHVPLFPSLIIYFTCQSIRTLFLTGKEYLEILERENRMKENMSSS